MAEGRESFPRRSPGGVAGSLAAIVAVAAAEVFTPRDVSLEVLYLLAVVGATVWGGRRAGVAAIVVSTALGLLADVLISEPYLQLHVSARDAWALAWNNVARGVVYLVGLYTVSRLQDALATERRLVVGLLDAEEEIRALRGLLPVCAWCGRIRDDEQDAAWKPLDRFVAEHTGASVTHGICPDCAARLLHADPPQV